VIAGFEASGVVVECGDHAAKNGFAIGDRVFLLMDGNSKSGSFAEFCQTKW
jgi:NADPH:quinone reductase-like Zn-dependent oxidoreductase